MRSDAGVHLPDYRLCRQTVTLYHADHTARTVTRTVLHGVFLDHRRREVVLESGSEAGSAFLLVIPETSARRGSDYTLQVHDRVLEGEGPDVAYDDWNKFLPGLVEGLVSVQYLDPKQIGGVPCHLEAGGWWTHSGSGAHSLSN
ncbi:MAG: hypothetical protein U0L91_12490 [Gemmiger sp.]|uniref:hypothetical protein n=1 Tax=Gemmiger sp. TaxID=2049027 RepID=UPI002E76149B|nr:hypothetical protein [Gemmiger sp.]MEE0802068.1 hypothetical protein [Gemmiger sp.]